MKNNKLILIGLAISILVWLTTVVFGIDLFEIFINTLESLEKFKVDEFIIPVTIFFIFSLADLISKQRHQKIKLEKAKIYHAMLSSTHHILNNFLNKMQLFKISIEKTHEFPDNALNLYNQIIQEAIIQIESMGNIISIDESSIRDSIKPKSNT